MIKFKQALLKFQALNLREQLMSAAAAIVVLYFLVDWALLGPQIKENNTLLQQIAQQKLELDGLTKVIAAGVADDSKVDGLASERAERDDLLAKVVQAESLISQAANGAPLDEMLKPMIVARPDLTLVSLKTLPAEVFYKPPPAAASGAQPGASAPKPVTPLQLTLYKHGVEVAVQGKYPALLAYLQDLQRKPNRMFWSSLKLDVATYPEQTLRMTIYILSDRAESPLG